VQVTVAGGVGLPGAELREARRRLDAHELDAELQHEIDSAIVQRHQEQIAIPTVVNQPDLCGCTSLEQLMIARKHGEGHRHPWVANPTDSHCRGG